MMKRRDVMVFGGCALLLTQPVYAEAKSAMVDAIQVIKSQRRLDLLGGGSVLKSYDVRLGNQPVGAKRFEGDGRTPEGQYIIDRRIPNSSFYLSLGVNYPSRSDLAYARRHGKSPGGNICLHGQPNGHKGVKADDWTIGCVALANDDMEEIYKYVPIGTQIRIFQ